MAKASRLTIRDLAAQAGVAPSTVSKALRNDPTLPPRTCQRIQRLAEKLGYRPNPLVTALMSEVRTGRERTELRTLAALDFWPRGWASLGSEAFAEFFAGATARAVEQGFQLETVPVKLEDSEIRRILRWLRYRGIRGLWIPPVPPEAAHLDLEVDEFVVATAGFSLNSPRIHRSSPHYYQQMDLALQELSSRGYRRIGFALNEVVNRKTSHALSAEFRARIEDCAQEAIIPPLIYPQNSAKTFSAWIEKTRPDALISLEPWTVQPWLQSIGVRIPQDLGLLKMGCARFSPEMTCVDQNAKGVGAASIDLLISALNRNEFGLPRDPQTVLIEGRWHEGETVAPRPVS